MAETETNQVATEQATERNAGATENKDAKPTVDELMAQLANEKAEREKLKSAFDKTSSELAKSKKELRSKLTAEEQEAEAKAEADKAKDERIKELEDKLNHSDAVKAYKDIQNEKTVETLIEAVSDNDHTAIANIIRQEKEAAVKAAQAEWLKSRPQANAGAYSHMTKEQIMAMPDRNERIKAIAQNQDLFK
ncbi:MAG: hypothetical protein ACI4EU_02975 [Butyrivibrio sp.]